MEDADPYETASRAAIMVYEEFTRNGMEEQIDTAISFAKRSLRYKHNEPEITNGLLGDLGNIVRKPVRTRRRHG